MWFLNQCDLKCALKATLFLIFYLMKESLKNNLLCLIFCLKTLTIVVTLMKSSVNNLNNLTDELTKRIYTISLCECSKIWKIFQPIEQYNHKKLSARTVDKKKNWSVGNYVVEKVLNYSIDKMSHVSTSFTSMFIGRC